MNELLAEVSRLHSPGPPAMAEELAAFERRVGWTLDPDLRAFYLYCNGAILFEDRKYGSPYGFLPLAKIDRARFAIYGEDSDQWGPAHLYALCDVRDGDYVALDVSRQEHGRYPLIDAFHSSFYEQTRHRQIASSLA
ncbi:MAG TPA: SMI1/KNR4 family protein, partial [Polyangia bacterium]|nr:SMI1/KNR4 family protein [Polyangia bacterium]